MKKIRVSDVVYLFLEVFAASMFFAFSLSFLF